MEEETYTKIVGVTFDNRQSLIRNLIEGEELELIREPENLYDSNAVAIKKGNDHLGYIERELAKVLSQEMDDGVLFAVFVSSVRGGGSVKAYGANIRIKRLTVSSSDRSRFRGRGRKQKADEALGLKSERAVDF